MVVVVVVVVVVIECGDDADDGHWHKDGSNLPQKPWDVGRQVTKCRFRYTEYIHGMMMRHPV